MSPANIEAKLKAAEPADRPGDRDRRPAPLQRRPDRRSTPTTRPSGRRSNGLEDTSLEELADDEKLLAAVQEAIDEANAKMARVEQIKKFKVLPTDWEPGGDELTPTMKLKRKPIAEKYADEIEELYSG